ncbi:phosphatidate phosphatase LPIN [Marchantia polymorpha subsp. ruderalis]|uniref:LNS2/PITP domain-containing protein n=2 Tax=Marchantia polymorpha TaxID=3197 RepID=A0AAF6B3C4_MARPO|nr:hypothetical protein MARPO_0089s0039 [Marchantia polymorpha]BBN06508.1 hypothetical protein Mp_3g21770 [Marchantia polymorpha subsp. ruderalis]|eukprot:PTQ33410.1 hypothetical protein MARPO_0089s0039 [Marchantia polymorpha]
MLTVGRVGTYIAQGVYTFSGPFHPFGGAVDIIVVQQEDGTYKSSPWYVKFGKFQGVLKRREKKVIVAVNDVDADFEMYLDHKGEAYFLKDDLNLDAFLEIEDSESHYPNEASSSRVENSAGVLGIEGCKDDYGLVTKADLDKEESEDERGDDLELMFEGREASKQLRDERAAAAVRELASNSTEVQGNITDVVGFPQVLVGREATCTDDLLSLDSENRSYADACRMDIETETCGKVIHTLAHPDVDLENLQGPPDSSAFTANAGLGSLNGASQTELVTLTAETSGEFQALVYPAVDTEAPQGPPDSSAFTSFEALGSPTGASLTEVGTPETKASGEVQNLVNPAVDLDSSQGPSEASAFIANAALGSLTGASLTKIGTLDKTEDPGRKIVSDSGRVIHGLLNKAVGLQADAISGPSSALLASATLKSLKRVVSPKTATTEDRPVSDWESTLAGKVVHRLLNRAIGLPETARSGPASALVAKAVLNSLSRVVSDNDSTPARTPSCAESKLVELSEDGVTAENEVTNAVPSSEEASSSSAETAEVSGNIPVSAEIAADDKLVVVVGGRLYPWTVAAPEVLGILAIGQVRVAPPAEGSITGEEPGVAADGKPAAGTLTATTSGGWKFGIWPFTRTTKPIEQVSAATLLPRNSEALMLATDAAISSCLTKEIMLRNGFYRKPRKVRTNSPSSQQLASLGLKEGSNKITFTFVTRVLGKQQVDARIYLWKWNTRIVISDVDGTITKSDVLGQVMPLVGRDWTQSGVARLFSAIKKNGYELMFLSARAISQAYLTRQFLENIRQDGEVLPDGPVVISPDGLFPSLYREVIRRAPHEFKIACLEDIKSLFPPESKPFYAGFGNRDTDELSYLKVGISKGKIFIINPKGEVSVNNQVDVKSYTSIHKLVDDMFPAMTFTEQEDFNEWNFWKLPLPDIDDEESVKSDVPSVVPSGRNFFVIYNQNWFEGHSTGSSSSRRSSKGDRQS